jgi:hypothetical protein
LKKRTPLWLMAFGLLTLATPSARAESSVDDKTRNAARSLAEQGRDVYDKGEYARAFDLFHRAYTLVSAPTIALYEGRSLAKLGRLVQAQEAYLRAVRTKLTPDSPEAFRKAVREAEAEEMALESRIAKVTLVLTGPGAKLPNVTLTADGEPFGAQLVGVEVPIDPGAHTVVVSVPGGSPTQVSFTIAEGSAQRVEVAVAEPKAQSAAPPVAAPPTSPPKRDEPARKATWYHPAAYAAGAVGVVGLATGIVTGSMAQSHYSQARSACPNHMCVEGSDGADELSSFRSLRTVSTVGYIVGGVGLAAGVTLLVLAPSKRAEPSAALLLGPSSATLRGAF